MMALPGILWALLCLGAEPPDAQAPRGELAIYPAAGVAFKEPAGWIGQVSDKGKTVAWWISPDSEHGDPSAIIRIECGRAQDASLDEVARGLARNFRGVVDDQPTSMGGTHALRITARNPGKALRPVEALATIHDGLLYLIMGGVKAGHTVRDELESIRASWTWKPIEPPSRDLTLGDKPLPFGGGAATINVPRHMHLYPGDDPARILDLGLHNFVRNEPDFLVYAQVVPLEPGVTFEDCQGQLSQGLQAQRVIKQPLEWRPLKDAPSRVISDMVEAGTANAGDPKRIVLLRWGLVKLDDRRVASVNFTLPPEAPGDRDVYTDLMERIVESIRPGADAARAEEQEPQPAGTER